MASALLIIQRSCQYKVTGKKTNDKSYARANDQKAKPTNLLDIDQEKNSLGGGGESIRELYAIPCHQLPLEALPESSSPSSFLY